MHKNARNSFKIKIGFLLFLFLVSNFSYADFALVNDPDGNVNVRSDSNVKAKIVDRLQNGTIIYCYSEYLKNGFCMVEIEKHGDSNSYVYMSKLKPISNFKKLNSKLINKTNLELSGDSLKINVKIKNTDKRDGEFINEYFKNGEIFGADENLLPQYKYESIELNVKNKIINIDKKYLSNLFYPQLDSTQAFYDSYNKTLYLVAKNGDGAIVYNVIWVFKDGRLVKYWVFLDANV